MSIDPTQTIIVQELTAALCIRAGLQPPSDEAANYAEHRWGATGIDLRAAAKEILDIHGSEDPLNTPARIRAAFSSTTGSNIFDGLVNTALTAPFRSSADTTRGWVIEREVNDFQANRRIRVRQFDRMQKRPRGGAADHLKLDPAAAETYKVSEYARRFVADEQDLADDDVEAITAPARAFGDMALALKLDLVYAVLLANDALADGTNLFHANHNNLATSSALTEANLDTGISRLRTQTENNTPLNTGAQHLLVPPDLEGTGRRLVRNMTIGGSRPLAVQTEPRLQLGVTDPNTGETHAGASGDWYLAAGDNVPTIEFGFIDSREPQAVRFNITKEGKFGVGWAVRWPVGAKALAYHGLRKHEE